MKQNKPIEVVTINVLSSVISLTHVSFVYLKYTCAWGPEGQIGILVYPDELW